jgi:hypothetical protein
VTTAKHDEKVLVLTAQDAAFVRQALMAASGVFAQAEAAAGPALKALQDAALDVPGGGRPLARVHYDLCLAVGYLDFPMPAMPARNAR